MRTMPITFGIFLLLSLSSFAASLYTETFDSSTAGWRDRDPGKMNVTNVLSGGHPGGALRAGYNFFSGPPFPDEDAIIATGNLSTASFIGNYEEVEAWLLGFDFMAANIKPGDFQVHLYASNKVIFLSLTNAISTTNVWYSFRLPLLAAELGGWKGDSPLFSSILTNVSRIEFRLSRGNNTNNIDSPAQFYFLDNIFLDRVPDAVDMTTTNMVWLHMRTGSAYRFEGSTNLNQSSWELIDTFTATTAVYQATVPATNSFQAYRMMMQ